MLDPETAARIARRWPYRGRRRIAAALGATSENLPERRIIDVADGRRFRLRRDAMYLRIVLDGDYALDETRMMRHLVRPGDCVVDVGANFGWFTTLYAREVGPTGRVIAVEPSLRVHDELVDHVRLNGLADIVEVHRVATGAAPGYATLHSFEGEAHGLGSLSSQGKRVVRSERVPLTTLDALIEGTGVPRVDLIKLDVEGAEFDALRGARETLHRFQPLVTVEINSETSRHFGYQPRDLLAWMDRELGYDTFLAFRRGVFVTLPDPGDAEQGEMILCCRAGHHRLDGLPRVRPVEPPAERGHETTARIRRDQCPICGGAEVSWLSRRFDDRYGLPDDFDLYECAACDCVYVGNPPDPEALARAYEKHYATDAGPPSSRSRALDSLRKALRSSPVWHAALGGVDLSGRVQQGHTVLDVGCGFGANAAAVAARGATWTGLDVNPRVVRSLRDAGLVCWTGTLAEFSRTTTERYDVILMSQYIEHVLDPIDTLRAASALLKPGGRIHVSCPNLASRLRAEHRDNWIHWHVPYHTVQFSPRTLRVAARRANLEIEELATATPAPWALLQGRFRPAVRGVPNSSAHIPFRPLQFLGTAPWVRARDVLIRDGGDALVGTMKHSAEVAAR